MALVTDVLKQRCPICRKGKIWRGPFRIEKRCESCDYEYEREQGYFIGSIYVSYILGMMVTFPVWLVTMFAFDLSWVVSAAIAGGTLLVLYPLFFHYARVIWMYFDVRFDPPGREEEPQPPGPSMPRSVR